MKTRFFGEFQSPFRFAAAAMRIACAFAIMLYVFPLSQASAEISDSGYETELRQKKRDFESYISKRTKSSDAEAIAAEALRAAREKSTQKQAELERLYQRTMKRYSMEEIEKLDRQDEERLAKNADTKDDERAAFSKKRNQRRLLEAEVAPVDPYREFDINMAVEPESKASHTENKSQPEN